MRNVRIIRVYVHVAYGFGAERWNFRWRNGMIIGINEPFAYGYHRAQDLGCSVIYSTDHPEGPLSKLIRYGFRLLLGFDFIHAWRNRKSIFSSDIVWTHTESQSLSISALFRLSPKSKWPKTIFQTIWLMDRWETFSIMRRLWYKHLLSVANVLSFHSPANSAKAKLIFPHNRIELIYFGINADEAIIKSDSTIAKPVRLLSIGNDIHRDWPTLRMAIRRHPNVVLRVLTSRLPENYFGDNAEVVQITNNSELFELYRWAHIVIVPLKYNLHASGITVIQEAVTQGVPVICSDTGGLTSYFLPGEVHYVPVGDANALLAAIMELSNNGDLRVEMVQRSQVRMANGGLNSKSFVQRHVELSRDLISAPKQMAE